jgi:hypothetical protein
MDLSVLVEPKLDFARLSEVLDGMGHEGRVHTIRTWNGAKQARIWEGAAGLKPIGLEHFVPASVGPLVEVVHELTNTLPLFTHSQKRFCRPKGDEAKDIVWGYNHQTMSPFTGPGYFVAVKGETEGEVLFDYTRLPTSKPEGWPEIRENKGLIPGIVYGGMIDIVRGVSSHVSIGRAKRGGKLADMYFTLCRKDVA